MSGEIVKSQQQNSEPDETSKLRASLIRKFLVLACEYHGRELTKSLIAAWEDRLRNAEIPALESALSRCLDECVRFPVPADVISRMRPDKRVEDAIEAELAERAWQNALRWSNENGGMPPGHRVTGRPLSFEEGEALRVVGGANRVECCPDKELVWVRKLFIEAFTRRRQINSLDTRALPESTRAAIASLAERRSLPQ